MPSPQTTIQTRSRKENSNPDWITAGDFGDYLTALAEGGLSTITDTMHELQSCGHVKTLLDRAG